MRFVSGTPGGAEATTQRYPHAWAWRVIPQD
jgi:hypothetical protein